MKVNMKNITKTQLIFGGVVLGLGVLIFLYMKNKPLPVQLATANNNKGDTGGQTNPTTPSSLDVNLILKQGSKGDEVSELQRRLINDYNQDLGSFGVNKDGIDGIFGTATLAGLLNAKKVSEIALKDL